jgi:hypothetical protein
MTTLVVQVPGEPVENANSYLDVTASNTLAAKLGVTAWTDYTGDKTVLLYRAAQYLENTWGSDFNGRITTDTQTMSWPRTEFKNTRGQTVVRGSIPEAVLEAQLLLASQLTTSANLQNTEADTQLSELTVSVDGAVARTQKWFAPVAKSATAQILVYSILNPYLSAASGGSRTVRA